VAIVLAASGYVEWAEQSEEVLLLADSSAELHLVLPSKKLQV
jgi:hypothetical protein